MKGVGLIAVFAGPLLVAAGCGLGGGGTWPVPMDDARAQELRDASARLVEEWRLTGEYAVDLAAVPKVIADLAPQFVTIRSIQGNVVVNVQVSGGFVHQGYLVVVTRADPAFQPRTGRNWRHDRLSDDITWYSEDPRRGP